MSKILNLDKKAYILIAIVVAIICIYIIQLFNLQVVSDDYKQYAEGNAFFKKTLYPQRGAIIDRNGKLIVSNQPTYDIVYVPREVQPFDTLAFCGIIGLTIDEFENKLHSAQFLANGQRNPAYSRYTLQTLLTQLSVEDAAVLQEKLYQFQGFSLQKRYLRTYSYPNAGLLLGYVAELNAKRIEADSYYRRGDYGGLSGIEASFEEYLRGEKGEEILLRDAHGRIQGNYEGGEYDKAPVSGKNIQLSLDIDLQAYGEELMKGKIGCIIAIEPSSGEILALVSSPSYDPGLLRGREYGRNYMELVRDPYKPLFNRATQGTYPPGSTYKVAQALVFLQEGAIDTKVQYPCAHGYIPLGGRPKCHAHASPVSVVPALATSCNAFFPYGLTNMLSNRKKYKNVNEAFEVWKDHTVSMGFGYPLGVDLPFEARGFIPNSDYYTKVHKTENWKAANIISIAIGQGEILTTPIQMANFVATVANRGYFYTPHIVKGIQDTPLDEKYTTKRLTTIDKEHYNTVVEGMAMSVTAGTSRRANLLPHFEVCGKTGTAENPHGKDHSLFMAFAPRENPQIAVFAVVENAGFGATYGLPVAKLMMERYLLGATLPEDEYLETNIINTALPPSTYYTRPDYKDLKIR